MFWAFNWAVLGEGIVGVLTWTTLLMHIWMGNKNKWLISMCIQLIISCSFSISLSYFVYQVWGVVHVTKSILFWMCLSQSVQNLLFNTSHFFIAYKYRSIARNVPCQLAG